MNACLRHTTSVIYNYAFSLPFLAMPDAANKSLDYSKKLALRISDKIDHVLDLVPQSIRNKVTTTASRVFAGLGIGIVFLYAATNSNRTFMHRESWEACF